MFVIILHESKIKNIENLFFFCDCGKFYNIRIKYIVYRYVKCDIVYMCIYFVLIILQYNNISIFI